MKGFSKATKELIITILLGTGTVAVGFAIVALAFLAISLY
jgi:hypothetical protein